MILSNAEPIAHRTPLKPIDLTPVWPAEQVEVEPAVGICQAIENAVRASEARQEANRIWKLVVQSAEAGGPVAGAPVVESLPTVDAVYPSPFPAYEMDVWADTAPSEYCPPEEDAA